MMRRSGRITLFILCAGVLIASALYSNLTARSGQASSWVTLTSEHMGTTISITVGDDAQASEAGRIVSDAFARVDAMMSEWKDGSPLAEINRQAGVEPVRVPAELFALIERSIELGDASGGAFDITWAALWGVWDFKAEHPVVPGTDAIAEKLPLIDYRAIATDPVNRSVFLPQPGMKLGLGGIAKGYAIEVAAGRLRDAGFESFLITAGGQVYAAGTKGDRPWQVGIRDPRGAPTDLIAAIELTDASASTSGDYERFFEIEGRRYHHILDPRTGFPGDSPRSVTVVCDDPTLGDALSTALMIVEPERREKLLVELGPAWAFIVDQQGRIVEIGTNRPVLRLLDTEAGG